MSETCCGCSASANPAPLEKPSFIVTEIGSPVGPIPQVTSRLTFGDRLGKLKMRWGFGRGSYRITPGLYAVGTPDARAPLLISANYKLSFDSLRRELGGQNLWILVIDTRGINVWCAAGKGSFSSEEILRELARSRVAEIVSHRDIIVPQLGAPGVSAHEVRQRSGFTVHYGPVRAADLPRYLQNGRKADAGMRRVRFPLAERLAVVPVELMMAMKYYTIYLGLILAVLGLLERFNPKTILNLALPPLGAILTGLLLVPILLPFIPFRAFALKGWFMGALWAVASGLLLNIGMWSWVATLFLLPALSAFLALNFTGNSTFTSQTGVNKEIRLFARPMGISVLLGSLMLLGRLFFQG